MFEELLESSNILGFISEESSEDGGSHKLVFRVTDKKRWKKLLPMLFRQAQGEETFGIIVNKQFYQDEDSENITFCWVLITWGDIEDILSILGPVLSKRAGPPPRPKSVSMAASSGRPNAIIRSRSVSPDGKRSVTLVGLPHRHSKNRNKKLEGTTKMGDTKSKGYAQAIGGDEGEAWDNSHREENL